MELDILFAEEFLNLIKNKNIIITGTSSGIGMKISKFLLKNNNFIWGCSRRKATINHKKYNHSKIDLSNLSDILKWTKKIKKKSQGKIDLLICNASVLNRSLNMHEDKKNIQKTINTNLTSKILLSKYISDLMIKKKKGTIIFFSSVASVIKQEGTSSYSASKSAIETFSEVLAKELKKFQVKVHTLRIIFLPTRLSKDLNNSKIKKILKKFKTNIFATEKKILKKIESIINNKLNLKTIIYDKKI